MHRQSHSCMRSDTESELGNQLSGKLRKSNKQTCYCVSVYVYVYTERERISVTLVTTAAQGCASDLTNARAPVCAGTISLISLLRLFVCRCTP
jgi:hypothetical protein